MAKSENEPYFFEKYFPASYHLTYTAPITRYPGTFNFSREDLETRSRISKNDFLLYLDVRDYRPEEIVVKTINEEVIVEGKQEKRRGLAIPKQFSKTFRLPEFFDSEDVKASISDDGILKIEAQPASKKKYRHLEELKAYDTVNKKK